MEETLTLAELGERLKAFSSAFLCTRAAGAGIVARPMQVVRVDNDGVMWFVTGFASAKVVDLQAHPDVAVTLQRGDRYAAISGRAEVHVDRELIRSLWSETWRPWFPEGPETADLALISVTPTSGELWDISGVLRKLRFLAQAGRAYARGEPLRERGYDHARLQSTRTP